MGSVSNTYSLTADEALAQTQAELNTALNDFDRWLSANPALANQSQSEYRLRQQEIKRLKLKMNEIKELKNDYQNTLMVLSSTPFSYINPNVPREFTRSKNDTVPLLNETMRVANKRTNRVSVRGNFTYRKAVNTHANTC